MKNRGWWITIALVAALVVTVYSIAARIAAGLIIGLQGESLDEAQAETGTPADFGLPDPEAVLIDAGNVQLAGWYFENNLEGNCGVMFMHGFLGTRYHALYFAPLFWERGCDILAYDHRGHGESTDSYHTYGYYEKQDALIARNWFAERSGLDPSRIAIAGVSYGAATALQMAPMTPEAPFILADSPYRSMEAIVRIQFKRHAGPLTPVLLPAALAVAERLGDFDVQSVSSETAVAAAESPILLMHSRTDETTPYTHSEAIYANSNQDRTVLHVNDWGAAHAADIVDNFAAYKAQVDDFLAEFAPDFGIAPQP